MRKKDIDTLPIRSFDNTTVNNAQAKFRMVNLKPENDNEGVSVEAHRHNYYHILFIKNGYGKHTIDFKEYEIKPNSIFFVSPGQMHSLEINHEVDGYVITFNSDFLLLNNNIQKLIDYPFFHSFSNIPVIYLPETNAKIQNASDEIYEEYTLPKKGQENIIRALLEVLLIRASRHYNLPIKELIPNHLTYQLRKLETLIDTHFKTYKKLDDYADLMFLSSKHLNSLCKKGLNKTVTNLIHERLLLEAKRLLLFTGNSISEITFELGFTDKSYFMRFFKKHMTVTADEYRKRNKLV